jgi:hypothetical protein
MGLKNEGRTWTIQEQIVEDLSTGLTLEFEVVADDPEAPFRLRISGDLPFGQREILFGRDGKEASAGMVLAGLSSPPWLTSFDEYPATD